jgi:hypothetical protein
MGWACNDHVVTYQVAQAPAGLPQRVCIGSTALGGDEEQDCIMEPL